MATIREHVYAVQNIVNKGRKSDDAPFSNSLILHFMDLSRNLLLERKLNNRRFVSPFNYQEFCVPMCESSWVDCCGAPDLGCKILKSVSEIPDAIASKTQFYLKAYMFSGQEIGQTTFSVFKKRKWSLTKKNKAGWFISNKHLYVAGIPDNLLASVWLKGVFEDPTQAAEFLICDPATDCTNTLDTEYPIEGELVDPMYRMVLQYLGVAMKFPIDDVNNAKAVTVNRDIE